MSWIHTGYFPRIQVPQRAIVQCLSHILTLDVTDFIRLLHVLRACGHFARLNFHHLIVVEVLGLLHVGLDNLWLLVGVELIEVTQFSLCVVLTAQALHVVFAYVELVYPRTLALIQFRLTQRIPLEVVPDLKIIT